MRSAASTKISLPTLLVLLQIAHAAAWTAGSIRVARALPRARRACTLLASASFDVDAAVLAAGFAFEAYNSPSEQDARWERGADGCDVAFMSEAFAREIYAGRLEVRLVEAKELTEQEGLAQAVISGSQRDPYVVFAMNEENAQGPKEGAIGLGRAVDRARSSTAWSKSLADQSKDRLDKSLAGLSSLFQGTPADKEAEVGEGEYAKWPDDEVISLYVKDPSRAQLALTVFDEEVGMPDIPLGATSVHLADLLDPAGAMVETRSWSGWLPLTWRPEETQDGTVQLGVVAGAAVAGPMGAAAGAIVGSMFKKPVQGQLRLELRYTPLLDETDTPAPASQAAASDVEAAEAEGSKRGDDRGASFSATLAAGAAPKGGSEGVDWSTLSRRVGTIGTDENDDFELCCFLTHGETSSEAAIWRDRRTRLVVIAFRGTSDIMDVVTDVNLLQTPLEQGYQGQKSDDERMVHSGFFSSARAVSRRLKELLIAACAGAPGEWELLITGHSLGGALATLMAVELVDQVDTSRGFKEKEDASLFGMAARFLSDTKDTLLGAQLPRWGRVRLYTYGAPRVGNSAFAEYFETLFEGREAFRIVNDRDIVPRMPRHNNVAGAVLDYEHCGKTVLVAEQSAEADGFDGFWVEGQSADAICPLRGVSPLSNPFSSGNLLGDVGAEASTAVEQARSTWSKIDAAAKQRSRASLQSAVDDAISGFGKVGDSIASRVSNIKAGDVASMIGLNKGFVEAELQLAESIAKGTALTHHLEPSYFLAMTIALDAAINAEGKSAMASSMEVSSGATRDSAAAAQALPVAAYTGYAEAQGAAEAEAAAAGGGNTLEEMRQLKAMLDAELITQADFDAKKEELLRRM